MISKKYKEILKKLETEIVGKKNQDIAKKEITELSLAYIDEITKLTDNYNKKISELEERLNVVEDNLKLDEEDFEETEEHKIQLSETITCPYCGYDFLVEYDETNHEITCPECDNLIELDWGEFEDDM